MTTIDDKIRQAAELLAELTRLRKQQKALDNEPPSRAEIVESIPARVEALAESYRSSIGASAIRSLAKSGPIDLFALRSGGLASGSIAGDPTGALAFFAPAIVEEGLARLAETLPEGRSRQARAAATKKLAAEIETAEARWQEFATIETAEEILAESRARIAAKDAIVRDLGDLGIHRQSRAADLERARENARAFGSSGPEPEIVHAADDAERAYATTRAALERAEARAAEIPRTVRQELARVVDAAKRRRPTSQSRSAERYRESLSRTGGPGARVGF